MIDRAHPELSLVRPCEWLGLHRSGLYDQSAPESEETRVLMRLIDITYVPMARGFMYLVAILDWATRKVLSWRVSNTLDMAFCVEALQDALRGYGPPDISNTDQGSPFTTRRSPVCSRRRGFRSAWTVAGDVTATFSLNGYGARLNTSASTLMPSRMGITCGRH